MLFSICMENFFILQLVISFFVGGIFIAGLSLLAERSSEKLAGMIISLPSTVVMGFFFMGWALGPGAVAKAAVVLPAVSGVIIFFTITYLYLSKRFSIAISAIGALVVWFLLSLPLAIFKIENLFLSLAIYLLALIVGYYFITLKPHQKSIQKRIKYTWFQILLRSVFAGVTITLVVFLSKTLDPLWGGVFSGFPAVYLPSLIIIHKHYDSKFLFKIWKNSPIGSLLFMSFGLSAIWTFPAFGIWGGTIASYLLSMIIFFIIAKLKK